MAENYVGRTEFDNLKKEVDEIKLTMKGNAELLQNIDKQVGVILTKLENADSVENLKLKPINDKTSDLEKKIEKVEGNQTWLWRAIATTVIGIIIKVIFDASKLIS